MSISPTASATSVAAAKNPQAAAAAGANSASGLSQTDFLNLLVAQLKNQDPLNPVSGTDFLSQTAQFSTMQGINQLNSNLTNLLSLQQLTQGSALIGKKVSYTAPGATTPQTGVVSAVNVANGGAQLVVGNTTVNLSQVTGIKSA
jgi:flagellar basal-body rod modification protein FlgD